MSTGNVNSGGTSPSVNVMVDIKPNGVVDSELAFSLNKAHEFGPANASNDSVELNYDIMTPKKVGCGIPLRELLHENPHHFHGSQTHTVNAEFLDGVTGEWKRINIYRFDPATENNNDYVNATRYNDGDEAYPDTSDLILYPVDGAEAQGNGTDVNDLIWMESLEEHTMCFSKSNLRFELRNTNVNNNIYMCDLVVCVTRRSTVNPCLAVGGCDRFNVKISETDKPGYTTLNDTWSDPVTVPN